MASGGVYRSKRQSTAAHNAVSALDADALEAALLDQPLSLNAKDINGYTPLHLACLKKSPDMVHVLLRVGGDKLKLDATDNAMWAPIHCAALNGAVECLTLLIDNGAQVDIMNNSAMTPLHYAALMDRSECVKLLLETGCEVNVRCTHTGKTPLHLAAEKSATDSLNLLLEHGASVIDTDLVGRTTIDLARDDECVGILEGYKSRIPWHASIFRCCIGGKVVYAPLES
mmetsp:Transcript_19644/g.75379  ORF Transcript_19644/g.75379 Transcript_19644/m.75379 type:complete len:228 (-) Transcript_19644:40-723(-)